MLRRYGIKILRHTGQTERKFNGPRPFGIHARRRPARKQQIAKLCTTALAANNKVPASAAVGSVSGAIVRRMPNAAGANAYVP